MNPDIFGTLVKARLSLHMRIDLFSVTGSPPNRVDFEEQELGFEIKTREDLDVKYDTEAF